jgi:hypothetical protein
MACSRDHIHFLIARGDLHAIRVPGKGRRAAAVRVLPADLDAAVSGWRTT